MHEPTINDDNTVTFDGVIIGRIHNPAGGVFGGKWYAQALNDDTSSHENMNSPEECAAWLVARYTHNATVADVRAYVRALETSHGYGVDLEELNARTLSLYITVLTDIASGAVDPRGMARAALGAKAAEFTRYTDR